MCGYALFLFSLTRATNKINHDTRTIDKDKEIQRKGILGAYEVQSNMYESNYRIGMASRSCKSTVVRKLSQLC